MDLIKPYFCFFLESHVSVVQRTVLRGGKTQFGLGGELAAVARHVEVLANRHLVLLAEDAPQRALDARLLLAGAARPQHHHPAALRLLHLLQAAV